MNLKFNFMFFVYVFNAVLKHYEKISYACNLSKFQALYVRSLYSYLYPNKSFIVLPY